MERRPGSCCGGGGGGGGGQSALGSIQSGTYAIRKSKHKSSLLGRLLATLDLRFADPKVECLYYNYYAQVKRNLLPTAIQVVLLVNLLQLLATCLHFYLFANENETQLTWALSKALVLPLVLQLSILVATFAMLRMVRAELSPKRQHERYERCRCSRRQHSGASALSESLSLTIETPALADSDEDDDDDDEEEERRRQHHHHDHRQDQRRSSIGAAKLTQFKLSVPYLLWLCQSLQLASGLWPQESFISYATLLLYSYTIYVTFPIRLMSCVLLALIDNSMIILMTPQLSKVS